MSDIRYTADHHRYGASEFHASRGGRTATGTSPEMASRNLMEAELRDADAARRRRISADPVLPELVGNVVGPALRNGLLTLVDAVIRPLPTLAIGGAFWCIHAAVVAIGPDEVPWRWCAHLFVGLAALAAVAGHAGRVERDEGLALNGLADVSKGVWLAGYWSAMAASVLAAGFMAGEGFAWLSANGWLQADTLPFGKDGVQGAAALAAFVWRRDFHPTLEHPRIPGLGF